jgi:HEAT repeat protein
MRKTLNKSQETRLNIAGIGVAVLLSLAFLAPAGTAAAAPQPQQTEQAKRSMGLTYDSLDQILKDLVNYKYDEGVGAPLRLRAYVQAHKDDAAARKVCETKLVAFLKAGAAPGGVMAACRSLSLIGSAASVPVLGEMLVKPETTDPARYALERIPGSGAENALLDALDKTQGDMKRGIISTLGKRAADAAVPALAKLAKGKDPVLALAAVRALGWIGTDSAARVLSSHLGSANGAEKAEAADGLLSFAGASLKLGRVEEATTISDKLLGAGLPDVDRQAAFRIKLAASGKDSQELILKTLAGKDATLYEPTIAEIPVAFGASEIGQVLPLTAKLPESAQVQFTAVLAGYPADDVLPAVLNAAGSPLATVRMEALRSIGKIGDSSVVGMLAGRAAKAVGDEQALARVTLARLKGTDVETAILDLLKRTSDDKVKAELIQAVSERRIVAGKPVLMEIIKTGAPALRLRAIGALREVSTPADMRDLLGLLFTINDETAREAMQDAAARVTLTIPRPLARGEAAENLLTAENDPKRKADLLRVLGKIGDDTALPLIRKALADPDKDVVDAAVRGLADWPAASARDDVYGIAASSPNLTHKVLALRAFVRMIGLEPYRQPEGAVADLEKALALASRPEEKKLVLGLLPDFPCDKGLLIAESLRTVPAVAAEAKAAADRIRGSLGKK